MKKSDIQNKASGFANQIAEAVEKNTFFTVGIIFATGYFSGILWRASFLLIIIAAIGITALWFLSDDETKLASSKEKDSAKPKEKKSEKKKPSAA